jgi:hypothetical protein
MRPTSRYLRTVLVLLCQVAFLWSLCLPQDCAAQDSTAFVDGFYSYQVGTLTRGCGDMTSGAWRWGSHHYLACYSAGWGIVDDGSSNKRLQLWGGVASGGGGACAACAWETRFESLTDYAVRAKVTPLDVLNQAGGCKRGMAGIVGRIQGTDAFCTGYVLALSLNNGGPQCDEGTSLQLLCNNPGQGCDGSEPMTLLASEELNISASPPGNMDPPQEFVLTLDFTGSDIQGAIWSLEDWKAGGPGPLAEVTARDQTYTSGTFGLYQESSKTLFDDVVVTVRKHAVSAPVVADVCFDPQRLGLKNKGGYLTCYIELPQGRDPWDIDVGTVLLNDSVPAELSPTGVQDHDLDNVNERMVKFDQGEVVTLLVSADESPLGGAPALIVPSGVDMPVDLKVSGALTDGTEFVGTEAVTLSSRAGGSKAGPAIRTLRGPQGTTPRISFDLATSGRVSLCIYDAAGRQVRMLENSYKRAGTYDVTWDRKTNDGRSAAPGVYFVTLEQGRDNSVAKMILVD